MVVDYIQDSLAIHEGMPAGDKLGGLRRGEMASRVAWRGCDGLGWRIGRHGEAAMGWDGVSGDMAGRRRAGMGRGLGKGGVCTFGTRKKSAI